MAFEFTENVTVMLPDLGEDLSSFSESAYKDKHGLVIEIAAIHEGVTQNFTKYTAAELANSIHTWHTPYQKPVIMNHDKLSEPIGRVIGAKMDAEEDGTPYARLQAAIVDPTAIQKVLDRRYVTGSIGGKTDEAVCSICNTDWAHPKEGLRGAPCAHQRGRVYKGTLATLEMRGITFVEYSFVNVPADNLSGVRAVKAAEESDGWNHSAKFFVLDLGVESIRECKEGQDDGVEILGEMKKKEATHLYHEIKGAFIQAQISNNIDSEESVNGYIGDTTNNESGIETSSEENESMTTEEHGDTEQQDEDILSITEGLSEDLNVAPATEDTSGDSTDATEQEIVDEAEVDTTESDDQSQTEEAEQVQETPAADAEDSVDASETHESENEDVVAEGADTTEQADETDLTEAAAKDELEVDQLKSEVTALKEENTKLKNALHRTLAERVVDAKIASGMVEGSDRGEMITEHAGRTASSLADSLRDLAKAPKVATVTEHATETVRPVALAVEGEANAEVLEAETKTEAPPVVVFENLLVDTLMGRKSL